MTTDSETQALQSTDADFFKALVARDMAALERLVAEDFLLVDVASGSVHSRAELLGGIAEEALIFEEITPFHEEARIRLAGPDTGVIVGRTAMTFRGPDGRAEVASRYTHVFARNGSGWQLFSGQGTPIS